MDKYAKIFQKSISKKDIYKPMILIGNADTDVIWWGTKEGLDDTIDSPFLMSSITKMFVTVVVANLLMEKKISLDDRICEYLEKKRIEGIHIYKGQDYTNEIRVRHLLFQTSGLPDYYGKLMKELIMRDRYVFKEEIIDRLRKCKPKFIPGQTNKAAYSDANFDLLEMVIEKITQKELRELYECYIFKPLKLLHTHVLRDVKPVPAVYYGRKEVKPSRYLTSCHASGGGITTARELMIFLKAFYQGKLFEQQLFEELEAHKPLGIEFGPLEYAGGYMYAQAGYPFSQKYTIVGHSGSTGSFAYYVKEKDMFMVGTVNQIKNPQIPVQLVMKLAAE